MAYNLTYLTGTRQNPSESLNVPDNGVTARAGITLPGKNYLGYGAIVNQSLLSIVENFASYPGNVAQPGPYSAIEGQMWYDAANTAMRYNISSSPLSPSWIQVATLGGDIKGNIGGNLYYTLTFDSSGSGDLSGTVYNAGSSKTISWNTIGAAEGDATGAATSINVSTLADVSLPGGSLGQVLTTDGFGILSWETIATGSIANGTSNVEVAQDGFITMGVAGVSDVLVVTDVGIEVNSTIIATGNANVANIGAIGGIFTYVKGDGGNLSNIRGANVIGNVTSAITSNFANFAGNVTIAAQPNITSVGTLTGITSTGTANLIGASNVALGPVTNVHITGGTSGQFLQTDGTGTLTWATVNTSQLSNGTSNVAVAASGNVTVGVAGAPSVLTVTATGINVAGTINGTGNANLGNIGAAGGIFTYITGDGGNLTNIAGANVIGNVTSAVTSNFANFAGNITVAAQPNITSVGTLTSLTVTGDATAGNLVTGGNVTATGNVAATGNVSGGNVTTGGIVSATGNVSGGNVTTAGNVAATGNVSGGNVTTAGNVVAAGNIQADTAFIGNAFTTRTGPLTLTATGTNNITLAVGTGNINLSTPTNITNVKDPVNAQDAATKIYVDALVQGLKPKAAVNCATSASITLTAPGATIDGHTLVTNDRVLVKSQTTASENGIYTYDGTGLVRATDADSASELGDGVFVFVESGTTFAASGFVQTATVTTLGTDPVVFTQFSAGGSYTAGTGLTLSGSQFRVSDTAVTAGSYGNATHVPSFTVNQQGQLTAASATAVTANAETLTGTTLKSTIVNSSLTSVGTLVSLAVTGGVTAATFTGAHIGDGGNLSNINGANVTGTIATANYAAYAGNITIAAQPNVTSVGTLTSLTVGGVSTLGPVSNVKITGGTNGQILSTDGTGTLSWITPAGGGGGGGDVVGPATAVTDNAVVRFDATTGKLIQNSLVIISDAGAVTGVTDLTASGVVTATGNVAGGNITTAGNVVATGNVAGGNITTAGNVVATGNIAGANLAVTSNATVGGSLTVTGGLTVNGRYVAGMTSGLTTVVGIDCSLDNYFMITLGASETFSATNVPASPAVYSMTLEIITNGGAAITWPGSVYWPNGTSPTLSASGKTTLIMMVTTNGGAKWRASSLVDYTT